MAEPGRDLVVPAGPGLPSGATVPAGELTERFSR
ncbi:MAG: aminoacyl-tRNA hydrolase, partial [Microbacterium sp.]